MWRLVAILCQSNMEYFNNSSVGGWSIISHGHINALYAG